MKQELLQQLHDIEGLNPVSMWPLAVGYWILIGVGIGLFVYGCLWVRYYFSWRRKAFGKLKEIEKTLSAEELSLILRKIVLKRFKREECAGLFGEEWLLWLQKRDPKKFYWVEKGKLLLSAPYRPDRSESDIKELIRAAKRWVR